MRPVYIILYVGLTMSESLFFKSFHPLKFLRSLVSDLMICHVDGDYMQVVSVSGCWAGMSRCVYSSYPSQHLKFPTPLDCLRKI